MYFYLQEYATITVLHLNILHALINEGSAVIIYRLVLSSTWQPFWLDALPDASSASWAHQ